MKISKGYTTIRIELTELPEVRFTASGGGVAIIRNAKGIDCRLEFWGPYLAESFLELTELQIGDMLIVIGRERTHKWEDCEGNNIIELVYFDVVRWKKI